MGGVICAALVFGIRLIVTAPENIVTVFDFTNCNAASSAAPHCERVAFYTGQFAAVLNTWCGTLLIVVAVALLWELWSAAAPKPITDDFLKLLDDSFGHSWRRPRRWPWARLGWAYGFTTIGAVIALSLGLIATEVLASSRRAHPPTFRIETSERFAPVR